MKVFITGAALALTSMFAIPMTASADDHRDRYEQRGKYDRHDNDRNRDNRGHNHYGNSRDNRGPNNNQPNFKYYQRDNDHRGHDHDRRDDHNHSSGRKSAGVYFRL